MYISEINIYPIKSLKGISVESAVVEARGLRYDRRWMLTDRECMFLTQREFPRMALIAVGIDDEALYVTADGFGTLEIAHSPETGDRRPVTIWQSVCDGEIYGDVVNEWFSDVLGTDCQLVYMPDDSRRSVNPRFDQGSDIVSFADGYPLMAIGEASLADLNSRLAANAELPPRPSATPPRQGGELFVPLPMNRFRPNLVVSGSEAYAEDDWATVRIGDAVFRSTKPCERCVITTVDQAKGDFAGKEPLKTFASYRMAKDVMPERFESLGVGPTAVLFGQNLVPEIADVAVKVGDLVGVKGLA
jgi:uncharacterized protein YcbX